MEGGCDFQHSSGKAVKIKIVNFVSKPIGFSDIKKFIASHTRISNDMCATSE